MARIVSDFLENSLVRQVDKTNVVIDLVRDIDDLNEAFQLRRQAFVKGKNVPEYMEFDGNDFTSSHLLLRVDGKAAGTLRIRYFKDFAKMERLCIASDFRGLGLPRYLLDYTEDYLAHKGYTYFFSYILKELKTYWLARGFELQGNGQEVHEANLTLLPVIYPFKKVIAHHQNNIDLLAKEGCIKAY